MKKRLTILTCFMALYSFVFGQNNWGELDNSDDFNMSAMIVIAIDGTEQSSNNFEIGAFIEGKLRGYQNEYQMLENRCIYYTQINGDGEVDYNKQVTFKLYDTNANVEYEYCDFTCEFIPNKEIGNISFENNQLIVNPKVINFFSFKPVAKIGENYFPTLEEAINSAGTDGIGTEITMLCDTEGSGIVINKDVTIDFGGFTYTFTSPAVGSTGTQTLGFQILKDNTVTLQNGTLNVAETAGDDFAMLIQNYADLTITDMKLDGDHLDRNNYSYVLSVNCGNVVIDGSTSILANEVEGENHFAFDSYDYSAGGYTELPVVTVNTTGKITGAVEVSATLNLEAVGTGSQMDVRITGNGQLYNEVAVKGSMTKKVAGTTEGWGTISSPVGTVEINAVEGLLTANSHDFYRYNEETMMWENVKDNHSDFGSLEAGRGYLYANTANTNVVFKGTFNANENVQVSLGYHNNVLAGFHFVGNPFTHNITETHFSATDATKLATGFYAVTPQGALESRTSGTIAPMESVMIKTTGETVLNINKKVSAKRSESENNGQIRINVANSQYSDVAYVSFNEGIGLDKINHRNAEIPMVYIPVEGVNYAIAMMNQEVTEIPVSFEAKSMGQYTIGVEAQDCEYAMMTLVDRFTGVETNLLIEDYTFMATSNDNAERFIIKLAMSNSNDGDNENFAFINNGMMYIYNIEGQGVVNVYDVTGRPVAEYNVETSANISTADFAAGVYIIRMSDENGVKVQKIVVE
ncbi:MAG: T9SS type A sorting domain-containing protein [Lentimicrobiaceae bacterium]|nr:T9SS type A sorting domain-containing protein [Lentimicrobiaceae bacterium]